MDAPRATAAVRRALQHSQKSLNELAEHYGINPKTVAKWKKRNFANDAPMGPKGSPVNGSFPLIACVVLWASGIA
jgi:hypothetical protein